MVREEGGTMADDLKSGFIWNVALGGLTAWALIAYLRAARNTQRDVSRFTVHDNPFTVG
jgi:hypothetical protein